MRDPETINAYLYEFFDETEEKPCPGCGAGFLDSLDSKGARVRFHSNHCDYTAWIDQEDLKNRMAEEAEG